MTLGSAAAILAMLVLPGTARAQWGGWESLGGIILEEPECVSWSSNRIDCFARGTDRAMWHRWWDGSSWGGWESLGGIILDPPSCTAWGPNRIDCFARGRRPALITARWSGATTAREAMTRPDYMPVALEILSGAPYRLTLSRPHGNTAERVTLTAYEARAHVEISVDAPGLLGGPSCSAALTSTGNTNGDQP